MSLLSVIQRASALCGLDKPQSVVNGTKIVSQMVELARLDAEDLAQRHDWQELETEQVFTTVAAELQPVGLPLDFLRMAYLGSIWDRTANLRICDLSLDAWEMMKAGGIGGVYSRVYMRGGKLYLVPAPPAGHQIAFPYISSNLYATDAGSPKATWDDDADACRIPENVIALGVVWRWKATKGFAYAEDMMNYERALAMVIPAAPAIHISRPMSDGLSLAWPGILG